MNKLSTEDCRKFLVTDPSVQAIVKKHCNISDYDPVVDSEQISYCQKTAQAAQNPRRWRRQAKYGVGSKRDLEGGGMAYGDDFGVDCVLKTLGVDPRGGVVREFWLEHTDHITVVLLEKAGKLFLLDDLSD